MIVLKDVAKIKTTGSNPSISWILTFHASRVGCLISFKLTSSRSIVATSSWFNLKNLYKIRTLLSQYIYI